MLLAGLAVVATSRTDAQGNAPACLGDTLSIRADSGITSRLRDVAAGVTYQCIVDRRGPWALHVVRVALDAPVSLDAMRATDAFLGRERVDAMASRWRARGQVPLIGINADFFNLRTGEVTSTHIEGGEWVKGITRPDTVGPPIDNARSQVATFADGSVRFGRFELHGEVHTGAVRLPLEGLNAYPPRSLRGAALFTPRYGPELGVDSLAREARSRVILHRLAKRAGEERFRVRALAADGQSTTIPADGAVLVLAASAIPPRTGSLMTVRYTLGGDLRPVRAAVGGWGRLLLDGRDVAAELDRVEGTNPDFSAARHPRSAVGSSADGRTLLLVVVDGRRPWSVGMSLVELARAMRELGAWNAINLDGGGSSTLWVDGHVVNAPSDAAGPRAVGNALWVLRTPRKSTP